MEGERLPAGRLPFDEDVDGSLGAGDTAVYTLSDVEGTISISVVGVDAFDPVVQVVDGDGSFRGRNDDFAGCCDSFLTLEVSAADVLEVEVTEFSGDVGSYVIRLERGSEPPG